MSFQEIVLLIALLASFAFELAMLVNIWQCNMTTIKKVLYTAAIVFFGLLAALIYFFGFRQKETQAEK